MVFPPFRGNGHASGRALQGPDGQMRFQLLHQLAQRGLREVARTVALPASDAASFINATELCVDGGMAQI